LPMTETANRERGGEGSDTATRTVGGRVPITRGTRGGESWVAAGVLIALKLRISTRNDGIGGKGQNREEMKGYQHLIIQDEKLRRTRASRSEGRSSREITLRAPESEVGRKPQEGNGFHRDRKLGVALLGQVFQQWNSSR